MSQSSTGSRPPTGHIDGDVSKRLPTPTSRALPPIQNPTPTESPQAAPATSALQKPPGRASQQISTSPDQRSSRPIGVQNLLNPSSSGSNVSVGGSSNLSLPAGKAQTSRSPPPLLSHSSSSMTSQSPVNVSLPSISQANLPAFPQTAAQAMTPRASPSVHHQMPFSANDPLSVQSRASHPARDASIGTQASQGPEVARIQTLSGEPHASSVAVPRSPPKSDNQHHPRYKSPMDRNVNLATGSLPTRRQSDSPSTQNSSFSRSTQTPPPSAPSTASTGQPQSFFTAPFSVTGPVSSMAPMAFNAPAASSTSTGGTYQMMTLNTENGPIQVPVDVQAASKVADEKRKRNATASHRFRQRRKEKERETSQSIARLEQQVREMEEEREHYRRERDYFREVAVRNPGQTHLLPRPISPRQRRHASMGAQMHYGNLEFDTSEAGARGDGRNMRRRTSNYVPATGPPPQVMDQPPLHSFDRQHLP